MPFAAIFSGLSQMRIGEGAAAQDSARCTPAIEPSLGWTTRVR